ncbi:MAG: hypothetical protein MZV70_65240 [Desulfobacterales bacterium]|nr:hypothetical protein [Desulfobacterales bacterium]
MKVVHERLVSLGKTIHKIHVYVLFIQGNDGNAESDHQGQQKADDFVCAHDGSPARPQDHIRDCQKHHECQGGARNNSQPLACFLKKAKHVFHILSPYMTQKSSLLFLAGFFYL